jgi:LysR family transcriptional regulator of gallate degradation
MHALLPHLRVLSAVVREGGIRPSSESLFRAASAISRSIGLLESVLDAQLFERKAGGMLLTSMGELVHARFERIEQELGIVLEDASTARVRRQDDAFTAVAVDALFDERRLLALSLLAELQHMPSVGRHLGISQPAVSAVLSRIEGALGQKLFLRTARGMMPTDAGARWVNRFDRALAELRYLEADVAAAKGSLEGVITVGTLPLARTQMLPLAVSSLLAQHPRLRIHSLESPYEQLCAGLLSGKIDFIVGALRPHLDKALTCESLFADELGLIAAATHPLATRKRLRLADLRPYRWVLSRPGTPLRESLSRFFASHGEPAPVPAVETGDQALVRGLLLQGPMLTILSTRQLRYEIDAGHLCVLALPMEGMQRQIGLTTRTGARLSAAARALIEQIRKSAHDS